MIAAIPEEVINNIINDLQKLNKDGSYIYKQRDLSKKYDVSESYISGLVRKMGMVRERPKLSKELVNNIIKDLKKVDKSNNKYIYSYKDIAKIYNISCCSVKTVAKENNLVREDSWKLSQNVINNIIKDLKEMNKDGSYYKYKQIYLAKKYNISLSSIRLIMKDYNLTKRRYKLSENIKNDIINILKEINKDGKYKYKYKEVADMYNLNVRTIQSIAKANKLYRYNKNIT